MLSVDDKEISELCITAKHKAQGKMEQFMYITDLETGNVLKSQLGVPPPSSTGCAPPPIQIPAYSRVSGGANQQFCILVKKVHRKFREFISPNPLEDQRSPDPLVTMHVAGKQHEKKQMVAVAPGQLVQFTRGHFYYVSDCLDIER